MSSWARWGWLGVAINALFALANLVCIVFLDGTAINWVALVVCTASGVYVFNGWRDEVNREHRWTA